MPILCRHGNGLSEKNRSGIFLRLAVPGLGWPYLVRSLRETLGIPMLFMLRSGFVDGIGISTFFHGISFVKGV